MIRNKNLTLTDENYTWSLYESILDTIRRLLPLNSLAVHEVLR